MNPMISPAKTDSRFRLTDSQARELASAYGTPLYVIDEAHFRARIRRYLTAFRACWPRVELAFASKANSTLAVLAIAHQEGCVIDVASEGELRAALAAGVPAGHCHMHGNNKSEQEIEFALDAGVSQIVIDNFQEIRLISEIGYRISDRRTKYVLRLAPGVDPVTHHKISTGQADTKFGFNIADGSAEGALAGCLELGLNVVGFHCHVGSQLLNPEAQQVGGELIAQFAVRMKKERGFEASYLNVGGGLGVKYTEEDEPMPVEDYCKLICESVGSALEGSGLNPTLGQEPGRSLIAESGLTLYEVGVVKQVPSPSRGTRTYVAVDGGLADNPRPVMYGARYEVERVARLSGNSELGTRSSEFPEHGVRSGGAKSASPNSEFRAPSSELQMTVSGRHCETDMLFEDVMLPSDVGPGDLLQVLCTGAYNSSMASNYNRYPRPATALLRQNGSHEIVQRRDSWDEMLARETVPKDLQA